MGEANGKSDLWIAGGVVFCLGLGASLTYWLSASAEAPRRKPVAAVQGESFNTPKDAPAPTPAAQVAKMPAPAAAPAGSDFVSVNFDTLGSYFYEIPNLDGTAPAGGITPAVKSDSKNPPVPAPPAAAKPKDQIPAPIRAFSGRKVAVQGFMVPIRIEKGAAKSFLLVKDQSLCCYGRMPRMNEWISVKMSGDKAAKFIGDQPVTVFGKLDVGEEIEKGEVLSIYRLEADDVAGPLDL